MSSEKTKLRAWKNRAWQALIQYDDLYRNPNTGSYVIDTDESLVAASLADALRDFMDMADGA